MSLAETEEGSVNAKSGGPSESVPSRTGATESAPARDAGFPERYESRELLARGGMGEVRRAWDRLLRRDVAMKLLSWPLVDSARARARFRAEIELTARLEHPGIVSIYDAGELPSGRPWYAMRLLDGRTLAVELERHHATEAGTESTLRHLLGAFQRVCDAMVYAHARAVIHRDLKPQNIMVNHLGEVLILDWGLSRRAGDERAVSEEREPSVLAAPASPVVTRAGDVLGTPGYMPPEQALGEHAHMGPASDVYSLGAILYEILCGAPPFCGDAHALFHRPSSWSPAPLAPRVAKELRAAVAPLITLAQDCLVSAPDSRPTAETLAARLRNFRDHDRRASEARSVVAGVAGLERETEVQAERVEELRRNARKLLAALPSYASVAEKAAGWRLQDEAATLERRAALDSVRWLQGLRAALTIDPQCAAAHAGLSRHYAKALVAAEASHDPQAITQYEALLAEHDRGEHEALLAGHGVLTLLTVPTAARVTAFRYVERLHRLELEPAGELGVTPLFDLSVRAGSYLLLLEAPGHAPVRYPVHVRRGERWDGTRPGSSAPWPVLLPSLDELEPDELAYVPPGWFASGGDERAVETLPGRRVWVDGFVVQRRPVDNRSYLAFLNDLVQRGESELAVVHAPRLPRGSGGKSGASVLEEPLVYARAAGGEFALAPPSAATPWELDAPVALVDWDGARAYATWLAARSGRPFRLLDELEWEKAARGVDGRLVAFGDHIEPTRACMLGSHAGTPRPMATDSFPEDESPYGVRGMTGNVRSWCAAPWQWDGPRLQEGRLVVETARDDDLRPRAVRGGAWSAMPDFCRAAGRFALAPNERLLAVGFRLGYSFHE
jgi:formylglycine-generating enzyme required for sulfatase activity